MSLFPAYTQLNKSETLKKLEQNITKAITDSKDQQWLTNSSFDKSIVSQACSSKLEDKRSRDISEKRSTHPHKKKKKSHKKHKEKHSSDYHSDHGGRTLEIQTKDDCFYVDKKCEKGNFSVPTLYRPAIPKYHISRMPTLGGSHLFFDTNKKKKKTFWKSRYFSVRSSIKDRSPSKLNEDNDDFTSSIIQEEKDFSKVTGDFNRQLNEEPRNVELWMKYVRFQDSLHLFEKPHSSLSGEKVIAEKKLAILDKALQLNPLSAVLLKARFNIAESVFTHDQLADDAMRLLEKDPSSLTLWRSLINSTRNNMTRCTVPSVLRVFSQAIERLHLLRRGATKEFVQKIEGCILVLLLECGLFLQQAGLWEQLWTLLQLYLTLNLSLENPNHFKVDITLPEKQLLDEEDVVIKSGLPLPTLWLRVEHLRSSVHFLPIDTSDDPQRIVFTEDLTTLLQPITTSNFNLQLVVTVITLLKVPLLPTRHSTVEILSFLDIPSILNNIESLLAAVYPVGPITDLQYEYLSEIVNLSIEPQFVRGKFGCTEYLTWVVSVMKACGNVLPLHDGIVIHCWVLRFYRLLLRLDTTKLTSLPNFIAKQSKAYAKELLKQPQYRDCLQLYIEYALVERELGNLPAACRTLETTAKLRHNIPEAERAVHTALYHTLVVTMLQDLQLDRNKIIGALISLVEMQPLSLDTRSPVEVKKSVTKSHHISTEIIKQAVTESEDKASLCDCFLPHLCVEKTACHAWFLYLTQSVWAGTAHIQEVLTQFQHSPGTKGYVWREQLWEVHVSMLHYHVLREGSGYSVLRETLQQAIKENPNNLHLLNTIATLETSSVCGTLWWKLMTYFPADSILARLILIFIARCKLKHRTTEDSETDQGNANRLYNLLKLSTTHPITKKCPLIWRLYLQFVGNKEDKLTIKNTFYKALEECPWVKCIYFEAAQFLPEELPEIQDLIIEKELRLHTTPEELEVLRIEEH